MKKTTKTRIWAIVFALIECLLVSGAIRSGFISIEWAILFMLFALWYVVSQMGVKDGM